MKAKELIALLHNAAGGDNNFYDAEVIIPLGVTDATVESVRLVAVPDAMHDRLVQVIQLTLSTDTVTDTDELSDDEANEALDEDVARAEAGETPLERQQRKLDEAAEAAHNKAMFGE